MKIFYIMNIIFFIFFYSCADLQRAKINFSKGKYQEAQKELTPLLKKGFPQAYYLMGLMIAQGKIPKYKQEEAIKYFKKAYELGYNKAARELGYLFMNLEKYENALKWLSIALNDGFIDVKLTALKVELLLSKEKDDSDNIIKKIENEAKYNPKGYEIIGDYYLKLNNKKEAEKYYLKAFNKNIISAGVKVAKIYISLNEYEKALILLKKIYNKYHDKEAALLIGRIYEAKGRNIELPFCPIDKFKDFKEYLKFKYSLKKKRILYFLNAKEWYKISFPIPEAEYRYMRIKWILNDNPCGDYFKILNFAKKGLAVAISDIKKFYYGGRCKLPYESLNYEINNEILNNKIISTINTNSFSPAHHFFEKGYQLLSYNRDEGIKLLKKSCRLGSPLAEIELALLQKEENPKLTGAVLYYYAKEKRIPRAMFALSQLYFSYNKNEKALKWLKKAANEYNYTPAKENLAIYLLKNGKIKEVLTYLKQLEKDKYCFASILLGALYEGDYATKVPIDFEKSIYHYKIALTNLCPESYFRLARLYFFLGNIKEAFLLAKKYITLRDNQIKGFVLIAKIALKANKPYEAGKYIEIAIEKGYIPSTAELEMFLPYLSEKVLKNDKIKWKLYFLIGNRLKNFNFKLSFCLIYKAALNNVYEAPLILFKIVNDNLNFEDKIFMEKVSNDFNICDKLINKNLEFIERFTLKNLKK